MKITILLHHSAIVLNDKGVYSRGPENVSSIINGFIDSELLINQTFDSIVKY